ncbi:GGDEF domain-containing protein [Vibrio metoecus]
MTARSKTSNQCLKKWQALIRGYRATFSSTNHFSNQAEIATLQAQNQALELQVAQLQYRLNHDFLTGVHSREMALTFLDATLHNQDCFGVALVLIDVDGLKQINDNLGHKAGDAALKRVGNALLSIQSYSDCVARFGGDEFIAILPNHSLPQALHWCNLFQIRLAEQSGWHDDSLILPVTVSIGFYIHQCSSQKSVAPEYLIEMADRAMYKDKKTKKKASFKYAAQHSC